MTTPSDHSDPTVANPRSPTREAVECEAGLRRVLAYICARRHRRWIAYVMIFSIIYAALATVLNYSFSLLFPPFFSFGKSFLSMAALVFYGYASRLVPLAITVLIFLKLHRIYKSL